MSTGTLGQVASVLLAATSVAIGTHVDPDGDAIGSMLALKSALDTLGVATTAVLANGDACPVTYAFLPGADLLVPAAGVASPDVFVALDSPVLSRLGAGELLARAAQTIVAIDHHPDADIPGALSVFDSTAAATGLIVWSLLPHLGIVPTAEMATCAYAALLSDTGRFSYGNTTADALRAAASMVDAGADPHAVYAAIYENRSAGAQALIARTLARTTPANSGHVVYSWIDAVDFADTGAVLEESENLIDQLRPLAGVDAVFLAKIEGATVRVSLRAKGNHDVGSVARAFGGGGHRAAAGFTYQGTFESLLRELLPSLPGAGA